MRHAGLWWAQFRSNPLSIYPSIARVASLRIMSALQVRGLIIFRREMYALVFAISPGVRPISPGRRVRSARSACGPAQGKEMRVLFRESSILVRFFIPVSFALDTMLLPFIRFEAKLVYS
eukprot:scaffold66594_cov38-Phaeocystis_antarctica.AAC.1